MPALIFVRDARSCSMTYPAASRTKIKAGIEKLLSCAGTVAGCVLNGVQAGLSGYGYGKYGYGYGYGKYGRYGHYGYGHYGAHRTREETV